MLGRKIGVEREFIPVATCLPPGAARAWDTEDLTRAKPSLAPAPAPAWYWAHWGFGSAPGPQPHVPAPAPMRAHKPATSKKMPSWAHATDYSTQVLHTWLHWVAQHLPSVMLNESMHSSLIFVKVPCMYLSRLYGMRKLLDQKGCLIAVAQDSF